MSTYGISDDLNKDFQRLLEKFKKEHPMFEQYDPDAYGTNEVKNGLNMEFSKPLHHMHDFKETIARSPIRKKAGILNMNLLN